MKLYLFDFDGTLTKGDSMVKFLKFAHPLYSFAIRTLIYSPVYLFYLLRILSNEKAKKILLWIFFYGLRKPKLIQLGRDFSKKNESQYREKALNYIEETKSDNSNSVMCIVSASLDIWMEPIASSLGMDLICTKSNFSNDSFTGLVGKNCYGKEKEKRIKEKYDLNKFDKIFAFGDSKGDIEMLNMAHHAHYKYF